MSEFFETKIGSRLKSAQAEGKTDEVDVGVREVLDGAWNKDYEPNELQDLAKFLQNNAMYTHVVSVGDVAIATETATVETRRRYCQALIEMGALHAAELELRLLVDDADISAKERGEALGLLGRLLKQRYIDSKGRRVSDLSDSIAMYLEGWNGSTDPAWHGVNLLALMKRADRAEAPKPEGLPTAGELVAKLEAYVQRIPANKRTVWDDNTLVEVLVAKQEFDRAQGLAEELANSSYANAFELGSLRRQLIEVWELEDDNPVLLAVTDRMLQFGRDAQLEVPQSSMVLEKILGGARPVGYNTLVKGLECAKSVCKITNSAGEGMGTGFLVTGNTFHESLGDKPMIATNAHVAAEDGSGALRPAEAHARFDVLTFQDEQLVIKALRQIWSSPEDVCDVTLLEFDAGLPNLTQPIHPAPVLPLAKEDAFVYVIGHPSGAGLKLSIRGNDLMAYDDTETRVHYKAPTEGGSSGSPVFNEAWELIAVHHAGSEHMRRLDDETKRYKANEGITLDAIRKEYDKHLA